MNTEALITSLDLEPERALLSGILHLPESIGEIADTLHPSDFVSDAFGRIFSAMVRLWTASRLEAANKNVDLATLADELKRAGDLDAIAVHGRAGYSVLYALFAEQATGGLVAIHAKIIRDRSALRRLSHVAAEIAHSAQSPNADADEIVADAQRKILAVGMNDTSGGLITLAESLDRRMDEIDQRARLGKPISGVSTGFGELDNKTAGLHKGELVVIAARPSVGKTSIGMAIARNAATAGVPVFFASLEQSPDELSERVLCMESGVDSHHVRTANLTPDDHEKLMNARARLRPAPFVYLKHTHASVIKIAARARLAKQRCGLGLVVVDYLGLIDPEDRRVPRWEQVGLIAHRLKALARELDCPVVCLSQLNRAAEDRSEPRLSDLRESGDVEQDADVVLLMHRLETTPGPVQRIIVNVAKNRNGRIGPIELDFVRHCTRFENAGIPL